MIRELTTTAFKKRVGEADYEFKGRVIDEICAMHPELDKAETTVALMHCGRNYVSCLISKGASLLTVEHSEDKTPDMYLLNEERVLGEVI